MRRAVGLVVVFGVAACGKPTPAVPPLESNAAAVEPAPTPIEEPDAFVPGEPGQLLEASLTCRTDFCDGGVWLELSFRNPGPGSLVLEAPQDPEETRRWVGADVFGEWSDGTGFGFSGFGGVCGSPHGACWAGKPVEVAPRHRQTFALGFQEARALPLRLEVEASWRESSTRSANDAVQRTQGWTIKAEPSGESRDGCVPVECKIADGVVDEDTLPPPPGVDPNVSLEVREDGTCWAVYRRRGCTKGPEKTCVSPKRPHRVRCP